MERIGPSSGLADACWNICYLVKTSNRCGGSRWEINSPGNGPAER